MSFTVDPVRTYEFRKGGASEVCTLTSVPGAPGVANNTSLYAGVAGKKHRLMGMIAQSNGAIGTLLLKSATGGSTILQTIAIPANTSPPLILPITDSGYCETNAGEGIFCDVGTTAINLTLFVCTYTP